MQHVAKGPMYKSDCRIRRIERTAEHARDRQTGMDSWKAGWGVLTRTWTGRESRGQIPVKARAAGAVLLGGGRECRLGLAKVD